MKQLLMALCAVVLCRAAHALDDSYKGPDAGTLVYSVGHAGVEIELEFFYKKIGEKPDLDPDLDWARGGRMHYNASAFFGTHDDYEGNEAGAVKIASLAPGDYEVYAWRVSTIGGFGGTEWTSHYFSLPFTIKPGQTTYIGTFESVWKLPYSPYVIPVTFLIADRQERDLPIARKKKPDLPEVTIQVPDVTTMRRFNISNALR